MSAWLLVTVLAVVEAGLIWLTVALARWDKW